MIIEASPHQSLVQEHHRTFACFNVDDLYRSSLCILYTHILQAHACTTYHYVRVTHTNIIHAQAYKLN